MMNIMDLAALVFLREGPSILMAFPIRESPSILIAFLIRESGDGDIEVCVLMESRA